MKPAAVSEILILHSEATYYAGAETMLQYYLEGLAKTGQRFTVACVAGSKLAGRLSAGVSTVAIPNMPALSIHGLRQQFASLSAVHRKTPFALIHSWAARSWELASLASWRLKIPALGTLHDHPSANFISRPRQWLMAASARWGLQRVAAVSEAVRNACVATGYSARKLEVVRNGLPCAGRPFLSGQDGPLRMGFLGAFSERKGFRGLFEMLDEFSRLSPVLWECHVAGEAQTSEGRQLVSEVRQRYGNQSWWSRVHWPGWVNQPLEFLGSLNCLLFTSTDFDPFPTVLLEAGLCGLPVVASQVGGVPEIIRNEENGWLFAAGDWPAAARLLAQLATAPARLRAAGAAARKRVESEFTVERMVADYRRIYAELSRSAKPSGPS